MKTAATIILMCFGVLVCQGQSQLKLSIKQGSDSPNYETEHLYLLELTNTTRTATSVSISTKNTECSNVPTTQQIAFDQTTLETNKQSKVQQIVVEAGKTVEFYIKLSRPQNARVNSWNCTEVVALAKDGNALSNSIIIESLIPNPNNNN